MVKMYKIAVLVGSLRKESYSRKLALILKEIAPKDLQLDIVEIADLALYNEDLETASPPVAWKKFRDLVQVADGVIFVTPEYNRSIPGALKNAIDVGSRPYGQSVWNGKAGAVISLSQGAIGGFGANHQLRQALVFNDIYTMQQPEAYIGSIQNLINKDGKIANDDAKKFLSTIITSYANWVNRVMK